MSSTRLWNSGTYSALKCIACSTFPNHYHIPEYRHLSVAFFVCWIHQCGSSRLWLASIELKNCFMVRTCQVLYHSSDCRRSEAWLLAWKYKVVQNIVINNNCTYTFNLDYFGLKFIHIYHLTCTIHYKHASFSFFFRQKHESESKPCQETWLQPLLRNIFGNLTVSVVARYRKSSKYFIRGIII